MKAMTSFTNTHIEIPRWEISELDQKIEEIRPRIAVFDFDGTLWSGDAGFGFMIWSIEQGLVSRTTSDWIDSRHRDYRNGKVTEIEMCGEMTQIYAGLREQELRQAASQYIEEHVRPRVFPELIDIVERLHRQGVELWAVSSTNKWVIAEGVRPYGIPEDKVLAAEVKVENGTITSEIVDVPTGDGKAASLRRLGVTAPDLVFGNSVHDLAMLDMARLAIPVNPSPALLEACAQRNWSYYQPAIEGSITGANHKVTGE